MTTIKWILAILLFGSFLASPTMVPDLNGGISTEGQSQVETYGPGNPECCLLGLECCTTPPINE
jgi:hypothetical protein